MKSIWCLFSVDNEYCQPDNNLIAWWSEKPSIETIKSFIDPGWACEHALYNDTILKIVGGMPARITNTDYRLDVVEEGTRL